MKNRKAIEPRRESAKNRPKNDVLSSSSSPTVTGCFWKGRRKKIRSAPAQPNHKRKVASCKRNSQELPRCKAAIGRTSARIGSDQKRTGTIATAGWLRSARAANETSATKLSGASLASRDVSFDLSTVTLTQEARTNDQPRTSRPAAAGRTARSGGRRTARRGQGQAHELTDVQRAFHRDRIAHPADGGVLVAGGEVTGGDVGHEREVQVQALAAGRVLFVADQTGGSSVDAQARGKDSFEAGLLAQLAAGGLERRLARLDLAPDREPQVE